MIKIKKPSDAPPPKPGGFVWKFLASFFGTGFSPVAPGTVASAVSFAILWFIPNDIWPFWMATVALCFLGVPISSKAEEYWGKDPSKVVIDEVAGCMITVLFLPKTLVLWVIGFLGFRFYDILKLPPGRAAERRLPKGWGIMTDDIVAGIYAFILAHLFNLLFPKLAIWTPWIS
ncbi:phosphatidylglycerophosphatase A [bacterium]|nr:phosphatidylglycerophosphatase A [bacterium]